MSQVTPELRVIEQDVPWEVIDGVLQEDPAAQAREQRLWAELQARWPNLRLLVDSACRDLAPRDLEQRERVSRHIIGILSAINETSYITMLDTQYSSELDGLSELFSTTISPQEPEAA